MNEIRLLQPDDVTSVMRLNRAANWNQTEDDWRRLLRIEPEGCFVIDVDGEIAATATAVCYGQSLAWIGMVLTDPAQRGQGHARRLMEHALSWLETREIEWIKLDATDMGYPLYARLGFVDESPVERWGLAARTTGTTRELSVNADIQECLELDRAAFGADRARLLTDLSQCETVVLSSSAYAMGRAGANAAYFGPCVSNDAEHARNLLQWFIETHPEQDVYWDLLPENREALQLAVELGFVRRRQLVRMVRPGVKSPARLVRNDANVFAIAGFEYG